jgi:hypothetical protein
MCALARHFVGAGFACIEDFGAKFGAGGAEEIGCLSYSSQESGKRISLRGCGRERVKG